MKASDHIVLLERVAFREAVALPGRSVAEGESPLYPSVEKIVGCYPKPKGMMAKQPYNLALDKKDNVILVEHPESGETETVPMANVLQWRVLRAVIAALVTKKPETKSVQAEARQ